MASGYFVLFPARVGHSLRLYRALFPHRGRLYHLRCCWRQFHNFTDVFLDRFLLHQYDAISSTSEGLHHLRHALDTGRGGILLMSHMGNWEVAAHLLKRKLKNARILIYMGSKQKEQIERLQKETLVQNGIQIMAVDENGGSPLDIIEGISFIDAGGVISLTGDMAWKKDQRLVPVKFLQERRFL